MSTDHISDPHLAFLLMPAAMALGSLWTVDAYACSAPPVVDCAAQITCVLGMPRLGVLPSFDDSDPTIESSLRVEVPARLHHSYAPPPEGEFCYSVSEIEVDVWLDCTDVGASDVFSGDASLELPEAGPNFLAVPLTLSQRDLAGVSPGDCRMSGKARIVQTNAVEIEVKCGPTVLSWIEPSIDVLVPVLEVSFLPEDGTSSDDSLGHYSAEAFAPYEIRVEVRNNHETEVFTGEIAVVTENANHKGVELTGGVGGVGLTETATYSLSEGEGDDFVIQSASAVADGCFDLPDPQDAISPESEMAFTLEPGETSVLSFYTRTWPTCADGSCSGMTYAIAGSFEGGETVNGSIGGSLMVSGSADSGGSGGCADSGEETTIGGCEDDEADCGEGVVVLSTLASEIRAGLVFDSDLIEARPAVVNTSTVVDVDLVSQDIEEDVRDPSRGRINETLWLAEGVAAEGDLITIQSEFSIVVIDGEGEFEVSEVVVGSKYQPEDDDGLEPPSSFIGLGRIEITTGPFTEVTTQYQAGVWTDGAGGSLPLEVVEYELTADGAGFVSELTLLVPEGGLEVIHLTHDIRGYSWLAYENVCDDVSDNDNDGLVDCDDDDCEGHPACDEEEESEDTGEADDPDDEEDPEDEDPDDVIPDEVEDPDDGVELGSSDGKGSGCSCSTAGRGLGFAFLLPVLIAVFRREEAA